MGESGPHLVEGWSLTIETTSPRAFWDPHESAFLVNCTDSGSRRYLGIVRLLVSAANEMLSGFLIFMFQLNGVSFLGAQDELRNI
jgi:hypothetical protein